MYEIWLGLNIAYEIALSMGAVLAAVLVAWIALLMVGRRHLAAVSVRQLLWVAGILTMVAFLAMPGLTRSSFGDMGYWLDWASLAGMALGAGILGALLAWPAVAARMALAKPGPSAIR